MAEAFDLQLPSGRVRAERTGPSDGRLVLCVHGLTANLRSFDPLVERLARPDRQVVAVDLRGRGRSEVTPPGTYGLDAHVGDVLEIASALGADDFDYVGWSMGAFIGIAVAARSAERVRRLVLLDAAGSVDAAASELVRAGTARLDAIAPTPEAYVDAVRELGVLTPWSDHWDRYLRYELGPHPDGVTPTSDRAACLEDMDDLQAIEGFGARFWPGVTMPALLVRCTVPIGGGLIVPESEREAMLAAIPQLRVVEVERNHYGLMTDETTLAAVESFV